MQYRIGQHVRFVCPDFMELGRVTELVGECEMIVEWESGSNREFVDDPEIEPAYEWHVTTE